MGGLSLLTTVPLLSLDGMVGFVPDLPVLVYKISSTGLAKCQIIHFIWSFVLKHENFCQHSARGSITPPSVGAGTRIHLYDHKLW